MKKNKTACLALDLEPDNAGLCPESYRSWNPSTLTWLTHMLKKFDIPLTVFVVGKSMKARPDDIQYLRDFGAEFHIHSFDHNTRTSNGAHDLELNIQAFIETFGRKPAGYRAPRGMISKHGLELLEKYGFVFDSSVIPGVWPHPKNLIAQKSMHRIRSMKLIEFPFTCVSFLRIPFTLSFIKLFGWTTYRTLVGIAGLPDIININFHLHDIQRDQPNGSLGFFWDAVYNRNWRQGRTFLYRSLRYLQQLGYSFQTFSQVIKRYA